MSKSGGQPRASSHVNRRVTQSGFRGFDYAMATDRPLNTYVVLHLRDTPAQGAAAAFTRIRHKHRDWQDRRSKKAGGRLPPIYVCVFENPNGQVHVNWTLHVPEAWAGEFERKLRGWVEKVQGPLGPYDLRVGPIEEARAKRLAKYIFKGTDPLYVPHFHLEEVHAPQGVIWGRRATISRAIGIKARERAGFHPGRRPYLPPGSGGGHPDPRGGAPPRPT